jgi:type IV secretory pathway protease TraF
VKGIKIMMKDEIEACRGQNVEIMANGILYKGKLIGASEESLSLQTLQQWVELPMEQISSIRRSDG